MVRFPRRRAVRKYSPKRMQAPQSSPLRFLPHPNGPSSRFFMREMPDYFMPPQNMSNFISRDVIQFGDPGMEPLRHQWRPRPLELLNNSNMQEQSIMSMLPSLLPGRGPAEQLYQPKRSPLLAMMEPLQKSFKNTMGGNPENIAENSGLFDIVRNIGEGFELLFDKDKSDREGKDWAKRTLKNAVRLPFKLFGL